MKLTLDSRPSLHEGALLPDASICEAAIDWHLIVWIWINSVEDTNHNTLPYKTTLRCRSKNMVDWSRCKREGRSESAVGGCAARSHSQGGALATTERKGINPASGAKDRNRIALRPVP